MDTGVVVVLSFLGLVFKAKRGSDWESQTSTNPSIPRLSRLGNRKASWSPPSPSPQASTRRLFGLPTVPSCAK
jgi:hypothetical protein